MNYNFIYSILFFLCVKVTPVKHALDILVLNNLKNFVEESIKLYTHYTSTYNYG